MTDQIELFEAIIEGAKQSKYGKDPGSNEPGNLTTFFKNVCNANPAAFLVLIGEMLQHDSNNEPSALQREEKPNERLQ